MHTTSPGAHLGNRLTRKHSLLLCRATDSIVVIKGELIWTSILNGLEMNHASAATPLLDTRLTSGIRETRRLEGAVFMPDTVEKINAKSFKICCWLEYNS